MSASFLLSHNVAGGTEAGADPYSSSVKHSNI